MKKVTAVAILLGVLAVAGATAMDANEVGVTKSVKGNNTEEVGEVERDASHDANTQESQVQKRKEGTANENESEKRDTILKSPENTSAHDLQGVPNASQNLQEDARKAARLFAYSTTTSIKRLATTTITAINTCLSLSLGTVCTGRRKRSFFNDLVNLDGLSESQALFSSKDRVGKDLMDGEDLEEEEEDEEDVEEDGKASSKKARKFTIISSMISTLTITSTSFLSGTTVTATAFCVAPGLTAGCFGK